MEFILSHEHCVTRSPGMWEQYPHLVDRNKVRERLVREFRQARDLGVVAMVDATTVDLGRETALVESAAQETGMKVIHATGIWLDIPMQIAPRFQPLPEDLEDIIALFTKDIREGIAGTDIKAGVIKLASETEHLDASGRLIPKVARIFHAAATVSKLTGVPITTHTDGTSEVGWAQIMAFEEVGVNPRQIVIGHSTTSDITYLAKVAERSYCLSMDAFAYLDEAGFNTAIDRLIELCRRGWTDRVMLGHDYAAYDHLGPTPSADREMTGWATIPTRVLPALEQRGANAADIYDLCYLAARSVFRF